jgi:hypothetical protein
LVNAEGRGDQALRLSGFSALDGLCALERIELRLAAESDASGSRPGNANIAPCLDQASLAFGKTPKHRQHQLARWACGVNPGIGE